VCHYEAVLAIDDRDAGAWYKIGNLLYLTGNDTNRAIHCLQASRALNPNRPATLYTLSMLLRGPDPLEEAQELLRKFQQLSDADVDDARISWRYGEQGSRYAEVIARATNTREKPQSDEEGKRSTKRKRKVSW